MTKHARLRVLLAAVAVVLSCHSTAKKITLKPDDLEDRVHPTDVLKRRQCFIKGLRKSLAYDLNQNYVSPSRRAAPSKRTCTHTHAQPRAHDKQLPCIGSHVAMPHLLFLFLASLYQLTLRALLLAVITVPTFDRPHVRRVPFLRTKLVHDGLQRRTVVEF